MIRVHRHPLVAMAFLALLVSLSAPSLARAQAETPLPANPHRRLSDSTLHIQGGIAAGFAIMTSQELTDLFNDRFGIGLGIHLSASVAVGVKHYAQVEIRWGDSAHTLRDNNIVTNETTEIPMDYDFTEYVGKFNVFALLAAGRENHETALCFPTTFYLNNPLSLTALQKLD